MSILDNSGETLVCAGYTLDRWRLFVERYRVDPCTGLPMPGSADFPPGWVDGQPPGGPVEQPPAVLVKPPPPPGPVPVAPPAAPSPIFAPPPAPVYVNDPKLGLVPAGEPVDNSKLAYLFRTPGRLLSKLAPAETSESIGWLISFGFPAAVWVALGVWAWRKFKR